MAEHDTHELPRAACGLSRQLHPVVLPHVSHFMQVPFRTSEKCPHSPHISPSYPFALASARRSAFDGAAAAAAPALLHCSASSFSVGDKSCWASCLKATAPSTASAARAVGLCCDIEVTFGAAPPGALRAPPSPPRGEGEGLRITTRLSVRERVRPFDRYLLLGCSGCLPSSTPLPMASKLDSEGSTWARSKRPM